MKDYATWRKGYDADGGNRKKAGFKVMGVYADVNNRNMISIIGEFPSAAERKSEPADESAGRGDNKVAARRSVTRGDPAQQQ